MFVFIQLWLLKLVGWWLCWDIFTFIACCKFVIQLYIENLFASLLQALLFKLILSFWPYNANLRSLLVCVWSFTCIQLNNMAIDYLTHPSLHDHIFITKTFHEKVVRSTTTYRTILKQVSMTFLASFECDWTKRTSWALSSSFFVTITLSNVWINDQYFSTSPSNTTNCVFVRHIESSSSCCKHCPSEISWAIFPLSSAFMTGCENRINVGACTFRLAFCLAYQ